MEAAPPLPPAPPQPIVMKPGTLIDYRLSLFGVGFSWRTRIEEYVVGERFVDTQLKGPYALWHHAHTFEDAPGGTVSVTRRIGRHRTALLALSGARIDGPTALEWGLIDEIVAKADGIPLFVEELTKAVLESAAMKPKNRGCPSPLP